MSLFKSVVDGISAMGNMVTANISPNKVQLVKDDSYDSKSAVQKGSFLVLYKKPGVYDCVFAQLSVSPKYYSLFRLTKEVEALSQYKLYDKILTVLLRSTSSLCDEVKLQLTCDTIRDHPTWTCAHVAAYIGVFECFRDSEVLGALNQRDSVSGLSPLMAAVVGRQKHSVHEMLMHGARVDMADNKGLTVYHYAVKNVPEVLDFLFDHDKFKTFNWMDQKGQTPLYKACLEAPDRPNAEALGKAVTVEMLLEGGVDPSVSKAGKMPIHVSVDCGDLDCIELILKKHPSQNEARDHKYGGTPLHWARNRDVTELLCRLGCDVDSLSCTNHSPLQVMLMTGRTECLMELLCYGADCNIGDANGDTPLHFAVQNEDIDLVRIFIVFGANVNQKNSTSHTPRHMAAISKSKNKDVMLHMLHVSGARRCSDSVKGCMVGCSAEGNFNGKPDEKSKPLFQMDKMALFDDMLCTAVSCTAMLNSGKGDALLDLTDGPLDIGDRVLCLDGGGIRGLVLIQLLAALEEAAGVPVKELFDWIAGTSTGGLLALGIGVGKPLAYIRGMYFRLKDQVFKGSRPYDSIPFENLLKEEFGETKVMTDIKYPKIIVTGVLADRFPAELHLFRNYQPTLDKPAEHKATSPTFEPILAPHEQLIWKTARSTGAAPTYFRAFGRYVDGGMMSNNPTLDALTEIHEYNTGLKFRNDAECIRPLGVVLSLGCGRDPVEAREHIDVYKPTGIFDAHKVYKGTTNLVSLLIDQASIAEGRPVDRARAWCSMINVPFFRFSPQLSESIGLDCTDNKVLLAMMWETQCYIVANKHRIAQVAQLLVAGLNHSQCVGGAGGHRSSIQGIKESKTQELQLHAAS